MGPLLFLLIYINDTSYSSNQLNFFLVADDTNLLYADKNLRSLEVTLNNELTSVCNWLMANKLSLNTKKSHFVIFRPYQKRMNFDQTIKLFDDKNSLILLREEGLCLNTLGFSSIQPSLGGNIHHLLPQRLANLLALFQD